MHGPRVQRVLRHDLGTIILLSLLVTVHVGVVSSIVLQDRPIIWPLHNDTIHRAGIGADFYSVYHAGLNFRRGINPYMGNDDGVTPYYYPFRYLPIVAIAAQPLTFLSPQVAHLVWIIFLEGLFALLLFTLWRNIPDKGVRIAAIGILLINSPYFLELYMGQFTFASVTLCCLAFLLPSAQLLFCGSVLLKPFTLAVLPVLFALRRYWSHGAYAILGVIILSTPYFMRHPDQWMSFYNTNFVLKGGLDAGNYGLVRLLQLFVEDLQITVIAQHWSNWIRVFRYATLTATALLVFHSKNKSVLVGVSALLLAHFLTYQHVWEHHMSGICVLGAVLLTDHDRRKVSAVAILFSLLLLALPTPFGLLDSSKDPTVWDPSIQWPRYASYLLVLSKVVPCIVLFLFSVTCLCKNGLMSPRDAIRSALTKAFNRRLEGRG